mmetsp:Transcript_44141/g.95108  ORF Transcript_44141/g.95108 Transcript_44141/m.95108 type:complete len:112 (+) Transcript_44141:14-349(+)
MGTARRGKAGFKHSLERNRANSIQSHRSQIFTPPLMVVEKDIRLVAQARYFDPGWTNHGPCEPMSSKLRPNSPRFLDVYTLLEKGFSWGGELVQELQTQLVGAVTEARLGR